MGHGNTGGIMNYYKMGETYILKCLLISAGKQIGADSVTIKITNSAGTIVVNSLDMTRLGTGIYNYKYQIPSIGPTGIYTVIVTASSIAADVIITNTTFKVS